MADDVTQKDASDVTFTVATDDAGGKHYQIVKLAAGALDTATLVHAGAGTAANALRASLASDDPAVVALQIMDDWDEADRAKVNLIVGQTGVAGGSGTVGATTQRVVLATDVALPAGTNAIGKLAANSGVDIGDVDVLSIAAGTNTIGDVGLAVRTTGGLSSDNWVSAASTNATSVKASAGRLLGWYIYNANAAMRKVAFHNTAGTPTAGTSVVFQLCIPPGSAANVFSDVGIAFSTGIAFTTVTGIAESNSTAVGADDLSITLFWA